MGGSLVPSDIYGLTKLDPSIPFWRNFFEDATTAQFNHRIIATTTFSTVCYLVYKSRAVRIPAVQRAAALMGVFAGTQFLLGIGTLLYMVPVPLAAAHQAGAVCLYTSSLWLLHVLKRFR